MLTQTFESDGDEPITAHFDGDFVMIEQRNEAGGIDRLGSSADRLQAIVDAMRGGDGIGAAKNTDRPLRPTVGAALVL